MTIKTIQLGRLAKIDVRQIWTSEASDFTPWLAKKENLQLLGETIGVELELEAQEKDVGPFRADILCKDTVNDHWVLIENQLERTDHSHLGQLLTYAAGLNAVTIVWIAAQYTEEHRAALDWLNRITESGVNFFGLEVELWQIGDSLAAPKFNVISKPNDWTKTVSEAASRNELTETQATQLKFWTAFVEFVAGHPTDVRPTKPFPQHWMSMGVGRSGFHLSAIAAFYNSDLQTYDSHEIRLDLIISAQEAKQYFALLELERSVLEAQLGYALIWHNPNNTKACRISVRNTVPDLRDESEWPSHHEWLLRRIEEFRRVFGPLIRELAVAEDPVDGPDRSSEINLT